MMLVPVISLLLIQLKLIACELTAWEYLLGADMFQSAVLDSQDRFSIRWLVDRETDTIDFVVLCNCTGWVGLSISSAPLGTLGAFGDIILVGYNDLTGEGYIEDKWIDLENFHIKPGGDLDMQSDVTLIDAGYDNPWTVVRFRRALDTSDFQDILIEPGLIVLEYAFSDSDNTSVPHRLEDQGSKKVMLIPVKY